MAAAGIGACASICGVYDVGAVYLAEFWGGDPLVALGAQAGCGYGALQPSLSSVWIVCAVKTADLQSWRPNLVGCIITDTVHVVG